MDIALQCVRAWFKGKAVICLPCACPLIKIHTAPIFQMDARVFQVLPCMVHWCDLHRQAQLWVWSQSKNTNAFGLKAPTWTNIYLSIPWLLTKNAITTNVLTVHVIIRAVNPGGMCYTGHATGREGHAICPILSAGHYLCSTILSAVTTTAVQFNLLVEVHCWSPALHSMQCMSVFCTHHVVIGPAWYKMVL